MILPKDLSLGLFSMVMASFNSKRSPSRKIFWPPLSTPHKSMIADTTTIRRIHGTHTETHETYTEHTARTYSSHVHNMCTTPWSATPGDTWKPPVGFIHYTWNMPADTLHRHAPLIQQMLDACTVYVQCSISTDATICKRISKRMSTVHQVFRCDTQATHCMPHTCALHSASNGCQL